MIGEEIKGTGWGSSKKQAEQEAARNALGKFNTQNTGEASQRDQSETNSSAQNTSDQSQ
jgi:dsRNA-specific ribonuclease